MGLADTDGYGWTYGWTYGWDRRMGTALLPTHATGRHYPACPTTGVRSPTCAVHADVHACAHQDAHPYADCTVHA
jgi:hypothetical protein